MTVPGYPPPEPGYAQQGGGYPPYGSPPPGSYPGHPYGPLAMYVSPKNLLVATLLCFFLGTLGIHRFYVGKVGTGILQLLTAGGLGIWVLIDFIMLLCQAFRDDRGLVLRWDSVR